jgi:hypothetical protein
MIHAAGAPKWLANESLMVAGYSSVTRVWYQGAALAVP